MAAAYAALVSLSHILQQILHPPPTHHFIIPRQQIESLREKVYFFIDFLENYSCSKEYENLEREIADAAYGAEDLIESVVVFQIRAKSAVSRKKSCQILCQGIQGIIKKLYSIEERLVKIRERKSIRNLQLENSTTERRIPSSKNTMIGFDDHLIEVMSALTADESSWQVFPIVGMGGIGKTTLARNVYNNPCIVEHFHVRVWVTISQEYTVREILLRLLDQINNPNEQKRMRNSAMFSSGDMSQKSLSRETCQESDKVGLLLYQELFHRKYLVVMDDIWSIQTWDKIKMFFPNNHNGSRVLVTTRLLNLAVDFGSCRPYEINLLDKKQSWDLLCEKVFGDDRCPPELVSVGKRIAERCNGLPLALVAIGGILAKSKRTREHWVYVDGNLIAALKSDDDEQCMKILSLSYNHLPVYLKPCFLYLAMFPEDSEISASKLVRMWVAEGFIKPTSYKSLEDIASAYLEELTDRNLILVGKRVTSGKLKTFSIHDLLRDLCRRKAHEDKFLCVANLYNRSMLPYLPSERRLSIQFNYMLGKCEDLGLATLSRCVVSNFCWDSRSIICSFRLLRVLDAIDRFSINEILMLVNLRYVACTIAGGYILRCPSLLPLWNLQTIVCNDLYTIVLDIWLMPQLRHIKIRDLVIASPPDAQMDGENTIVLENLQTLSRVCYSRFTEEVLERIPNLKKLGIVFDALSFVFGPDNLGFRKLESLSITGDHKFWRNIAFPCSLKKLILSGCMIPWEDMSTVGSLPNLEVLKLRSHACKGSEWNPNEGEFGRLKFLLIDECELEIWGAEDTHFPILEYLILKNVRLKEFPVSFAEILTLTVIEIQWVHSGERMPGYPFRDWTPQHLQKSVMVISEQREGLGYDSIQVVGCESKRWGSLGYDGIQVVECESKQWESLGYDGIHVAGEQHEWLELFPESDLYELIKHIQQHEPTWQAATSSPKTRSQIHIQQPKPNRQAAKRRPKPRTQIPIQQPKPAREAAKKGPKTRTQVNIQQSKSIGQTAKRR